MAEMSSGTLGSRTVLLVPVLPTVCSGSSVYLLPLPFFSDHMREGCRSCDHSFPQGQPQEWGPAPPTAPGTPGPVSCPGVYAVHRGLFAFPSPAADGQFSMNHNRFTPLGRIIKIGWRACLLNTQSC